MLLIVKVMIINIIRHGDQPGCPCERQSCQCSQDVLGGCDALDEVTDTGQQNLSRDGQSVDQSDPQAGRVTIAVMVGFWFWWWQLYMSSIDCLTYIINCCFMFSKSYWSLPWCWRAIGQTVIRQLNLCWAENSFFGEASSGKHALTPLQSSLSFVELHQYDCVGNVDKDCQTHSQQN